MMLIGILLGVALGLLAGGRLENLAAIRLRLVPLILGAVVLRFGTEALLQTQPPILELLRIPLFAAAFGTLLGALWANRVYPGLTLAFVGILSNATVILANGGYMPIWGPALAVAGFEPTAINGHINTVLPAALDASFLLHLGPLADIIPIPIPFLQNVASLGDLFLASGLAFFLFASLVRNAPTTAGGIGLSPALNEVAAMQRPLILGGRAAGFGALAPSAADGVAIPVGIRVRQHPYVRLALNGSFSALWAGQLISVLGDRVHIVALVAIVFGATDSVAVTAFTLFVSTLPNLFFSPIAGTLVDRWDRKEVMIVSDLLRAALVLLVPLALVVNVLIVFPLVFLITTISIFFRPARVAVLPQLVDEDDLVTANSAMWIGETVADVFGYSLAGLLVASLGKALPLAFWLDATTYIASAVLLWTLVLRPREPVERTVDPTESPRRWLGSFFGEMREGWAFLRHEPTLLANTLQATAGQLLVGALVVMMPVYVIEVYQNHGFNYLATFGFLETSVGTGNLIGGFVIGLVGMRIAKGRLVSVSYVLFGGLVAVLGLTSNLPLSLAVAFGAGVANMGFIIPSQALFQIRTPSELMGRVVSFRFTLVFGGMTVATGAAALLTLVQPASSTLAMFGLITVAAGVVGWFIPAIRDA
jgi:MFS transporter, DHA3 family, macrolide efflux protein